MPIVPFGMPVRGGVYRKPTRWPSCGFRSEAPSSYQIATLRPSSVHAPRCNGRYSPDARDPQLDVPTTAEPTIRPPRPSAPSAVANAMYVSSPSRAKTLACDPCTAPRRANASHQRTRPTPRSYRPAVSPPRPRRRSPANPGQLKPHLASSAKSNADIGHHISPSASDFYSPPRRAGDDEPLATRADRRGARSRRHER